MKVQGPVVGKPVNANMGLKFNQNSCFSYASVNSSNAHSPPGISGAFFLTVLPGGRALVYPGAFDGLAIFTSQHCHFRSIISLSGKGDKFVINSV